MATRLVGKGTQSYPYELTEGMLGKGIRDSLLHLIYRSLSDSNKQGMRELGFDVDSLTATPKASYGKHKYEIEFSEGVYRAPNNRQNILRKLIQNTLYRIEENGRAFSIAVKDLYDDS